MDEIAERVVQRYLAADESWIVQQLKDKVHDLVLPNRTIGVAIAYSSTLQKEWREIVRDLDLDKKRSRKDVGYSRSAWDSAVEKITDVLLSSPQACRELMALGEDVGYPKGTAALELLGPDLTSKIEKGVLRGPKKTKLEGLLKEFAKDLAKDGLKKVIHLLWSGVTGA